MNEINDQAIIYGNLHCWLSIFTLCFSIIHKGEITFRVLSMALRFSISICKRNLKKWMFPNFIPCVYNEPFGQK